MIECYYRWCPKHSANHNAEDGPFCHDTECTANETQMACYQYLRNAELAFAKEQANRKS